MFERILCVIDCFEGVRVSLAHLEEFKKAGTQEVVVLGVISQGGCGWTGRNLEECRLDQFEKERVKLEIVLKEIEKGDVKGKIRIEVGVSAHSILKAASEENASLIVMGTGSGSVKGLLLGRITEGVVRHAKVPVLVTR
jgi:nucleotide-binding universal stress UspA family protein